MQKHTLLSPTKMGNTSLLNHIVMAPMTRCRAIGNIPNDLMATYYEQRSQAGLIITEGTAPSPNGLGYARIPGIYSNEQVEGWKNVTYAAHGNAAKIFVQLMHTGRISHVLNMPDGAKILAPSAIKPAGQMWTDAKQMQDYNTPIAMTPTDIVTTKNEFVTAAKNAIEARFDGVELHAANGYLLEQFLSDTTNVRTDDYGGSIENRCRFVLEVVASVAAIIGREKTGIRLSPYGTAGDMVYYPQLQETYQHLAKELNKLGIAYIHLVDHSAMGAPEVPMKIKQLIRQHFKNTIILCGGYNKDSAEAAINGGLADLIAFGRPFINNPDLVERMANDWPLSTDLKMDLFYGADEKGYTDYPIYKK
jgi:N-ethylmaleimide reductase